MFKQTLVFLALLTASLSAHAVILEGTFSGTVYDSYDVDIYDGTTYFGGATTGGQNGQTLTGTFTIDTDLMPPDSCADPSFGCYSNQTSSIDFLQMSMTLSGQTFTTKATTSYEDVYTQDYGYDYYHVGEYSYQQGFDSTGTIYDYQNFVGWINFYEYVDDVIQGDSPIQTFNWNDNDSSDYGYGYYFFTYYTQDFNTNTITSYDNAEGHFYLNSMTLQVRASSVPEPGPLALLAVGLVGLGVARKRHA